MWGLIAKYAAQLLIYAAGHPDAAIAVINDGRAIVGDVKTLKKNQVPDSIGALSQDLLKTTADVVAVKGALPKG